MTLIKNIKSSATSSEDYTNTLYHYIVSYHTPQYLSQKMQKKHISIQIILELLTHLEIPKQHAESDDMLDLTDNDFQSDHPMIRERSTLIKSFHPFCDPKHYSHETCLETKSCCKLLLACRQCCLEVVKMMMHQESLVRVNSILGHHLFAHFLQPDVGRATTCLIQHKFIIKMY